jgi:hypothetical protein
MIAVGLTRISLGSRDRNGPTYYFIRLRPGYADAMVFQPMPLFLSLRNQIAPALGSPLPTVKTLRKKELGPDAPLLLATYTEAVTKFTKAAIELMEYARLLTEARNAYLLRQKECELVRLRIEIDSLKLVIPLLIEDLDVCQAENGQSNGRRLSDSDAATAP